MSKKKAESYLNISSSEEPYVEPGKEVLKTQDDLAADFGFYQDKITNLFDGLNSSINSGEPFFIWSRERQIRKMELNNQKQVLILNQIQTLKDIADEFMQLKAQAIFSAEYIKNLVEEKYLLAEQYFERKKEEHLTIIRAEQAKREHIGHDLSDREIAQLKEKAIIRRLNAEADKVEAEVREANARVDLIKLATGEINFSELPKSYQTYILTTFLNADANKLSDFDIREQMKDVIIQQAKAEADKKTAEVDGIKTKNASDEWKFGRDKKSVEKNDNR